MLPYRHWEGYTGKVIEYEVETVSLSNYIKEKSISKLDLIKIDVELYEPEVLEGLGPYLLKFQPIIILEILTPDVAHRIMKQISLQEFRLFHLKSNRTLVELDGFKYNNDMQDSKEWNYLLFHKNHTAKIMARTNFLD